MDKLKQTGQNWAEFSTLGMGVLAHAMQSRSEPKQTSLKLKTWLKPFLGYIPLPYAIHKGFW
jgi:hypothetical protein